MKPYIWARSDATYLSERCEICSALSLSDIRAYPKPHLIYTCHCFLRFNNTFHSAEDLHDECWHSRVRVLMYLQRMETRELAVWVHSWGFVRAERPTDGRKAAACRLSKWAHKTVKVRRRSLQGDRETEHRFLVNVKKQPETKKTGLN
jgi:hypothetical protein